MLIITNILYIINIHYSFVVYDFAFCQFLVTIIFVAVWNGTWQNLDTLFDKLIFNGDRVLSSIVSLALGSLASVLIIFSQSYIRDFAENGGL